MVVGDAGDAVDDIAGGVVVNGDNGGVDGTGIAAPPALGPGLSLNQGRPVVPAGGFAAIELAAGQGLGVSFVSGRGNVCLWADGPADQAVGRCGKPEAFDARPPFPFLPGKFKNAVDAYPSNPGFPLGQPALLGGDKAAENAPFSGIDGIVPLVAVFPGLPSFGFAKGVGLVNAAIEGFAAIFGQGFQDGGSAILMGKGLPIGAVPGDGPALRRGCPPPPIAFIIRQRARAATILRRDMAIPSRLRFWFFARLLV